MLLSLAPPYQLPVISLVIYRSMFSFFLFAFVLLPLFPRSGYEKFSFALSTLFAQYPARLSETLAFQGPPEVPVLGTLLHYLLFSVRSRSPISVCDCYQDTRDLGTGRLHKCLCLCIVVRQISPIPDYSPAQKWAGEALEPKESGQVTFCTVGSL